MNEAEGSLTPMKSSDQPRDNHRKSLNARMVGSDLIRGSGIRQVTFLTGQIRSFPCRRVATDSTRFQRISVEAKPSHPGISVHTTVSGG